MLSSFLASLTTTLSSHWISFFEEIHVLYWLGVSMGSNLLQSLDAKWGWFISPSLPLIGSGFIIPLNVNLSFVFGAFLCYGVTGPVLVNNGFLAGATGFKAEGNGTAQSLFLWGGTALMLFSSLTEVLLTSASALAELRALILALFASLRVLGCKLFRLPTSTNPAIEQEKVIMDNDPVPASEQIPKSWWVLGILISMSTTCLIMALSFQIPFYQTVLSVIFAFLLGIVAVQSAAETDINWYRLYLKLCR
ncbi:hypothetical protein DSO57_1029325 [Entomophthora muscae]|uniref:Uncharacterized protein n=1 Tax=Entomophthora muscae TaxID=34485 RepID=A0ACC2SE23_9FUNG|nr:hypothetical protein DSO57_1029325 [Entomophthora muscae]